ncbi:DUF896 domain-containing protein [Anoxybacillus sp. D401a]|uniref:DUF896 domain-containing protein n=1 Tax=Anoxybacillus sp. D401a TaxID=575112 RepID=UPI003D347D68
MLSSEKIARINALAKKAKMEGLTPKEKQEQLQLRTEYIAAFRASMIETLHHVKVIDPNGNDVTPKKLKDSKKKRLH